MHKVAIMTGLALILGYSHVNASVPKYDLARSLGATAIDKKLKPLKTPRLPKVKLPKVDKKSLESKLPTKAQSLVDSLNQLPQKLAVVDQLGNLLFNEVNVENGARAIEFEWITSITEEQAAKFSHPAIKVIEIRELKALKIVTLRFRVSPEFDNLAQLQKLLPKSWLAGLDRNHVFSAQSAAKATLSAITPSASLPSDTKCKQAVDVGMLDTEVETTHVAFKQARLVSQSFLPQNIVAPKGHGTAVASILVGNSSLGENTTEFESSKELHGALPDDSTLYAASVFYARNDYSQGAALNMLLEGLNWLGEKQVKVINMSLTGPPNKVFELAINQLKLNNIMMVAAVGNAGPATPVAYPAAYSAVIGATAVDKNQNIYRWANQGPAVNFAALGVNRMTARPGDEFGPETGTSMAAPLVTAKLACALVKSENNMQKGIELLQKTAIDLGEPGLDPVFGYGLLE